MGGVVGNVEDKSAEVGVGAERYGLEIGRKFEVKSIDALVRHVDSLSESVGMSSIESMVAVDAVGGFA